MIRRKGTIWCIKILAFRYLPGVNGFAWGGALLVVVAVLWLSESVRGQNVWANWAEGRDLRSSSFSEVVHLDQVIRTRANTWSNLSHVIVGLYAIGLGCFDWAQVRPSHQSYLRRTPPLSVAFGVACCYLGFASGLFHASLTRFGQQLDVAAMYAPLLVLISIGLGHRLPMIRITRHLRLATWPFLLLFVAVSSWLLFIYKWSMSSLNVLTMLIILLCVLIALDQLSSFRRRIARWLVVSAAFLVAAVVARQLDVAGNFSAPEAWWQGHALWHVLTSLSLACVFAYFRSQPTVVS